MLKISMGFPFPKMKPEASKVEIRLVNCVVSVVGLGTVIPLPSL